jgi:hypothetical protein
MIDTYVSVLVVVVAHAGCASYCNTNKLIPVVYERSYCMMCDNLCILTVIHYSLELQYNIILHSVVCFKVCTCYSLSHWSSSSSRTPC